MAVSLEMLVIAALLFSVFTRRNHGAHALSGGLQSDGITVATLVGRQMLGVGHHVLDKIGVVKLAASG